MKKLKKSQRVENYLNKLMYKENFGLEELGQLHYSNILGVEELAGIGDRTISNVLDAYKEKRGLPKRKDQKRKSEIVHDYLSEKLASGEMSIDQLLRLRYRDIRDETERAGVGKTTATCALSEFKKQHDENYFETGLMKFLERDKKITQKMKEQKRRRREEAQLAKKEKSMAHLVRSLPPAQDPDKLLFMQEEIKLMRRLIGEFVDEETFTEKKQAYELRELKRALKFAGINPKKLIHLYWDDISKGFVNQKTIKNEKTSFQDQPVVSQLSV